MLMLGEQAIHILGFVLDLCKLNLPPDEAKNRLNELRKNHPEFSVDLAWELDPATEIYEYGLLVTQDDVTVSINAVQNNTKPWAIRGSVRPESNVLLTVNGNPLTIAESITYIETFFDKPEMLKGVIDCAILRSESSSIEFSPSEETIEQATQNFFASKQIYGTEQIAVWLKENGLTSERIRSLMHDAIRCKAIERSLCSREYSRNIDLPESMFYKIPVAFTTIEPELFSKVRAYLNNEVDGNLEDWIRTISKSIDYVAPFTILYEKKLQYELFDLFGSNKTFLSGKVYCNEGKHGEGYLLQTLGDPDHPTVGECNKRRLIKARSDWFREKRRSASIEWNWGSGNFGVLRSASTFP